MTSICLNMVAGNEAAVIRRCLESVVDHIDYWVVNCNGDDETAQIVREVLAGVPGELLLDPWRNFAHNRSLVIETARGRADYHFCIDADEVLDIEGRLSDHITEPLDMLNYWVYFSDSWAFTRAGLLSDRLNWSFESVVHNYPTAEKLSTRGNLDAVKVWHHKDGFRWENAKEKYARNAAILEAELAGDPGKLRNRYQFYLGESYRDCGEKHKAINAYRARVDLGGWQEEVYWSLYQIARLTGSADDYLEAYEYRPSRAEALFELAGIYRNKSKHRTAYMFYSQIRRDMPADSLFLDRTIHDWKLWDALAISGYYAGDDPEKLHSFALRALQGAPDSEKARITDNLKYYVKAEQGPEYYDQLFTSTDYRGHQTRNRFWSHLRSLIDYDRKVIEVGCGTGDLSANSPNYTGYDFSPEAIASAAAQFPESTFVKADAYELGWVEDADCMYVICETLEHLERDLYVLDRVPVGAKLLVSVPSFDDPGHIRFFPRLKDAVDRYGHYVDGDWYRYEYWNVVVGLRSRTRLE